MPNQSASNILVFKIMGRFATLKKNKVQNKGEKNRMKKIVRKKQPYIS